MVEADAHDRQARVVLQCSVVASICVLTHVLGSCLVLSINMHLIGFSILLCFACHPA